MVALIEPAVRKNGNHFVATTTSPLPLPAAVNAAASARSDVPLPYISAVSNQLMPRSSETATTSLTVCCVSASQNLPDMPCPPENCQQPSPTGVTSISVFPSLRRIATGASPTSGL